MIFEFLNLDSIFQFHQLSCHFFRQSSNSPQNIIRQPLHNLERDDQAVIRWLPLDHEAVIRQQSSDHQAVIRQSSGSHLAVIWQSSRCQQEIISYSSDNWICLSKKDCQPHSAKILASQNNFQYFLLVTFVFLFCGDYFIYFS